MAMQVCKICLSYDAILYLNIFEDKQSARNISDIIAKHLWLVFTPSDVPQEICSECWNSLYEFNQFYETVEKIHRNHEEKHGSEPELADDPFDNNDHFDETFANEDLVQPELLETIKTELSEDENAGRAKIRRSSRIRGGRSASRDEGVGELAISERSRRSNTKTSYQSPEASSCEGSEGEESFSDSETVENKSRNKWQSESRKRKLSNSASDQQATDTSQQTRAKRKRDPKLFAHIDEFVCYICPERVEFDRFYHATVHYKKFHNEPAYIKCEKCDKRCYTPGNFISHLEAHADPDKFRCTICGKQNDQQVALAKHMRIHQLEVDEKLPIKCSLCPRRFATEKKRDRHEKHHDRKPTEKPLRIVGRDEELLEFYKRFSCEICENVRDGSPSLDYENMQDLKKHMRETHNDKGYLKCPLCEKKCNIRSMLVIHKDFHLNPENYRCEICGNIYQNLQKHKESAHVTPADASFCCEHCGKALTSEKSLKSHVERKHAVKDAICDICNKPFSKSTLESHKRVVHEMASYMCTHCPRMFRSKFSLNRHLDEHEDKVRERVKCTICGVTFKHKYILTKHIDSVHTTEAPVTCDVCGKTFKSKHHLWSHKSDTCNNRRYDCTICGRVFKVKVRLNEHMTTHTGKSLYQCTFCPLTFSFQSILYTHRKKAHYEQWLELQQQREEGVKFKVLEAPT